MKLVRLEHLDLIVKDIKASVEFYRKLGLYPEGTLDDANSVYMVNGTPPTLTIELHQAKEGQETGIDHVSFEVDDVQASYNELKFLGGIDFVIEPREVPRSGRTITDFYDPDGVHLQISHKTTHGEYEDWH